MKHEIIGNNWTCTVHTLYKAIDTSLSFEMNLESFGEYLEMICRASIMQ